MRIRYKWYSPLIAITLVLSFLLVPTTSPTAVAEPILYVHFIDVGQGDCILVDLGETEVLIDAGRSGGVVESLQPIIDGHLEVMVATHPDADHIGGLTYVLGAFDVDKIWLNGDTAETQTYQNFIQAVNSEGAQVRVARRGDEIRVGSLSFLVLHPVDPLVNETNNNSIVLRLAYGQVDFLFPGDAEKEAEMSMLQANLITDIDILKVSHHGSKGASSQEFLAKAKPEVAIYMAGKDNQYGHPHAETLARLQAVGAQVYGTDQYGTIIITTDGQSYQVGLEGNEQWVPYLPPSDAVDIEIGRTDGKHNAEVTITFRDAGYRVKDWGSLQKSGNVFSANAIVERWTGPAAQVITELSYTYQLGQLSAGDYNFKFYSNGSFVEQKSFQVADGQGVPLYKGVNFVTYRGETMPVSQAVASLPQGVLVSLWRYDNRSKEWAVYLPNAAPYASDLREVVHLKPYVVVVRQDCIWKTQSPEVANIQITHILYDGQVPRVESDEYVEITNLGNKAQDLAGWVLKDISDEEPSFTFPSYILAPGKSIRVYTNEVHPEYGGFSFGYGQAIWNNTDPDIAALYDAQGQEISRKSY